MFEFLFLFAILHFICVGWGERAYWREVHRTLGR